MIELAIVCEGQTEETFVRDVLLHVLAAHGVMAHARLIPTSKHGLGGALRRDRVLGYFRNTLRERADVYVTTFFDLYGLSADFPGRIEAAAIADPLLRAQAIEASLKAAVVEVAGCRPERFLPHLQPHEFEALLFSDVKKFGALETEWSRVVAQLEAIRAGAVSPEHINDGFETHPAARLASVLPPPKYQKVLHGPLLAESIGLERIRAECAHFAAWFNRLVHLPQLSVPVA